MSRQETLKKMEEGFERAIEFRGAPLNISFGWYVTESVFGNTIDRDCDSLIKLFIYGYIPPEEGLAKTREWMAKQ